MEVEIAGYNIIIDADDYDKVMQYKWYCDNSCRKKYGLYYFLYSMYDNNKKHYIISLHRHIMGCKYKDGKTVDHINGNTLDNRKSNLRICTHTENMRNSKKRKNNTTGYKGVYFHKQNNRYVAEIRVNKKKISLGCYEKPEDAHKAYCEAADKYHGEYANHG